MGLSGVTQEKLAKGEKNFVSDKEGKGSSVLGQVALEKIVGTELKPELVGENDKWSKGDPRLAIGLGDMNNKANNRIYMNGDSNQSLYYKVCSSASTTIDFQWDSVSRALEGREKLDLSHIEGTNILDAYSRCTTRDEKVELFRVLYKDENFNPIANEVPTDRLSAALRDKIENNTSKTFYDKESNHIKEMNIGGQTIGISVSNDPNIGKDIRSSYVNNVIVNPESNRIIINTDGKDLSPANILGAIGKAMESREFGDITVRGSQIVIKTEDLKSSPLTREVIVDIFKNAIDSKSMGTSTMNVNGDQLNVKPVDQMVYDKLESVYGKISAWDNNIIDAYVKIVDGLSQNDFDQNIQQVVNIEGFGEIRPMVDDNKDVSIQIKLDDEYKIGNRSFEVIDTGEVNIVTTYNDLEEIPSSIVEALNALPDEIKDSVDAIIIVRSDEMNNPEIQDRINNLRKEININGELDGKRIMVINESEDKFIPNILNATDKIIDDKFSAAVERVFDNSGDSSNFKDEIKEFVNELKLAFSNNYLNEIEVVPNKASIENASFHEAINIFLENTIEVKLNELAVDNSTNPNFDQVQDDYNALVDKIEQIKDFDFEEEGFGLDLDYLEKVIDRIGQVNNDLEDLKTNL